MTAGADSTIPWALKHLCRILLILGMSGTPFLRAADDVTDVGFEWNFGLHTVDFYSANREKSLQLGHPTLETVVPSVSLDKLVALARRRMGAALSKELRLCKIRFWPMYGEPISSTGWIFTMTFEDPAEAEPGTGLPRQFTASMYPDGTEITMRRKPMDQEQLEANNMIHEKVVPQRFVCPNVPQRSLDDLAGKDLPSPGPKMNAVRIGAEYDLKEQVLWLFSASQADYLKGRDLLPYDEAHAISVARLLDLAKAHVQREPGDNRVMHVMEMQWTRLGDRAHPTWMAQVYIYLETDLAALSKRGVFPGRDGDTGTMGYFFPDGGEVFAQQRWMTLAELAKFGLQEKWPEIRKRDFEEAGKK
jgi:hypothetical protein